MERFKHTPIGIIERFQSWNGQLFKISPPKRWKLRLPISLPFLLLGVGINCRRFRFRGASECKRRRPIDAK